MPRVPVLRFSSRTRSPTWACHCLDRSSERDHRAPFSSLTLSGTVVFWSLRWPRSCCRRQNQFASTFSRAAPLRPWQCRLDTGVPLATGRCEWRAASASKSAGLRRYVPDVPVATPQEKWRGGKARVSGLLLEGRCAAGHKTSPTLTPCFLSGVSSHSSR